MAAEIFNDQSFTTKCYWYIYAFFVHCTCVLANRPDHEKLTILSNENNIGAKWIFRSSPKFNNKLAKPPVLGLYLDPHSL